MALKGNLRDFSISQLLNLVNLAHKTGTLIIEGQTDNVLVCFREGKLAYAQLGQQQDNLVNILYHARKISADQHRLMSQWVNDMNDKELGLLLVNSNYLTQQDILASLQVHFVSIIHHLFNWVEGFFSFENDLLPPSDKIVLRISLENLIIEGTRRLRERDQLEDEIPNLDMALKFADRPGANIRNLNLSPQEWRVVRYISPRNSMRQIARASRLNDLEIRRITYSLLQAGVVEITRHQVASAIPSPVVSQAGSFKVKTLPPMAPPAGRPPLPQSAPIKEKSLINRLIERIKSL